MEYFMIGMYGKVDEKKFKGDYVSGFRGIEVCSFEDFNDINKLLQLKKTKDFEISVHFPLKKNKNKGRDPLVLSLDRKVRDEEYNRIEEEIQLIIDNKINPKYILIHFPKPVIIEEDFNLNLWKFASRKEYYYESEINFEVFKEFSEKFIHMFSMLGEKYGFIPVLELDAINKYIYEEEFLEIILKKYSNVKLCLDTGRLALQEIIDTKFDAKRVVEKFIDYTEVVHVWNLRVDNGIQEYHYPVLQNQKMEEGWGDVKGILESISSSKNNIKVLFEHDSSLINDNELLACYNYVREKLQGVE
ncbi:sugar phosphate isomerase/epimerase [Oceanirhabdus seepicola]|uniref:Sugar phosphate isomerase/epimerase n=1 Tax=Oceanirhabdus seepicola TaxID=2828781 RepID=A0A9J6P4E1_9CLOT|nr:sugar phosphate isomerase/epimerase [Oceanirhabdus seepicola]MCM1991575.1 sugar phosphate isomerase/epimerase [Oceanirhabdus seepicola]